MNRLAIQLGFAAMACAPMAAHAATITFDDIVNSPIDNLYGSVVSDGFRFTGRHFHIIDAPQSIGAVYNGTQYLSAESVQNLGRPVDFFEQNRATFSLLSADIAELFRAGDPGTQFHAVQFTGYTVGGGVLTSSFLLDGIGDGPGGDADFQTVTFGTDWRNLGIVNVTGLSANGEFGDFALDNLVVTVNPLPVVPEPATWAMMIAGFVLAGMALRRRKSFAVVHVSEGYVAPK